jgi:hypothetical protein
MSSGRALRRQLIEALRDLVIGDAHVCPWEVALKGDMGVNQQEVIATLL